MLHPGNIRRAATLLGTTILATALLAATAGTAAADAPRYVQRSVPVRVDGVDATTRDGARALYQRLRRAAARACDDGRDVDGDCARLALAGAVRTLDFPAVTALHERRGRGAGDGA